ncbi:hypothetical protein PQX77_003834 [Marasmius sp. AFHP31]|nr:hypothetical protein PQX77_003834 [Marasmius sp. AFHP31]
MNSHHALRAAHPRNGIDNSWYSDFANESSPAYTDGGTEYPTSSTFGPMISGSSRPPVDMLLLSGDSVMFYTDEKTLLDASKNSFKHLLPFTSKEFSQRVLFLRDISSSELEIMLRAIHDVSSGPSQSLISIDVQTLIRAIDHLPEYGISPVACITPKTHLYRLLLSCAPLHPLEIYAQAAHHGLGSLAVTVSSHTLVVELAQVTDELSMRMGPVYALRLFQLHTGRVEILKKLLSRDLGLHNPTAGCTFDGQRVLKAKWNLGIANMFNEIKPGTTTSTIRETMMSHTAGIECRECNNLRDCCLRDVINDWTMTSRTIARAVSSE